MPPRVCALPQPWLGDVVAAANDTQDEYHFAVTSLGETSETFESRSRTIADESTRAVDVGEMYAVLPSIEMDPGVREAYADRPSAPVGAYRSDGVPPLDYDAVRRLIAETLEADRQAVAP